MTSGMLSGIMTVFAFVAFLGVTFWAFSPKRKKDFDSAARLPLNDDGLAEALDIDNATEPTTRKTKLHDKEAK